MRFKPWTWRPQTVSRIATIPGGLRWFFSWHSLGSVLLGILLAKWIWLLLAPVSPSLPATAAWKKTDAAERLFGTAIAPSALAVSSLGNSQLIGVFAHPTEGFAVLQVDNKQIGVALGGMVSPGVRLVETHADHVILEYAGLRQRADLQGLVTASGTSTVIDAAMKPQPDTSLAAAKAMDKLQTYQQNMLQQPSK